MNSQVYQKYLKEWQDAIAAYTAMLAEATSDEERELIFELEEPKVLRAKAAAQAASEVDNEWRQQMKVAEYDGDTGDR